MVQGFVLLSTPFLQGTCVNFNLFSWHFLQAILSSGGRKLVNGRGYQMVLLFYKAFKSWLVLPDVNELCTKTQHITEVTSPEKKASRINLNMYPQNKVKTYLITIGILITILNEKVLVWSYPNFQVQLFQNGIYYIVVGSQRAILKVMECLLLPLGLLHQPWKVG